MALAPQGMPPSRSDELARLAPQSSGSKAPSETSSATRSRGIHKWSAEERVAYLKGLGILQPEEKTVLRFLDDALGKAPLPAPWKLHHDSAGRAFFANRVTGTSTWTHPLEPSVRELVGVCRMCLASDENVRGDTIQRLSKQWEGEAKRDLSKWYSVKHENGKEYYCHRDTGESMWTHPAEVVMPLHYIKIQAVERLSDDTYLRMLFESQDDLYCMTPSNRSPPGGSAKQGTSPQQGVLEAHVSDLASSNTELKALLARAENDLRKAKQQMQAQAQTGAARDPRFAQLESELEIERQRVAQKQKEWADMSVKFSEASKSVTEAERRTSILEVRLAALTQDVKKKNDIMASRTAADIAVLEDTFTRESIRREQLLGLDSIRSDLAEKLRQSMETQENLRAELAVARAQTQASTGLEGARSDLAEKLRLSLAAQETLRSELAAAQAQAQVSSGYPDRAASPKQRNEKLEQELKSQLREAVAMQAVLRDRLNQAEKQLEASASSVERAHAAEAQLTENRTKFEECFKTLQDAERQKGMYEAQIAALQKDVTAKEAKIATIPPLETAVATGSGGADTAMLLADLQAAKAEQTRLREEVQAARAEAAGKTATLGASTISSNAEVKKEQERIAALELELADEKRQKESFKLQLSQTKLSSGTGGVAGESEALQAARTEAERSKERAAKAEVKLKKEMDFRERVWQCVRDAEVAKKALEMRLHVLEENFKGMGGDERLVKLQVEVMQEKERVKESNAAKLALEQQLRELAAAKG